MIPLFALIALNYFCQKCTADLIGKVLILFFFVPIIQIQKLEAWNFIPELRGSRFDIWSPSQRFVASSSAVWGSRFETWFVSLAKLCCFSSFSHADLYFISPRASPPRVARPAVLLCWLRSIGIMAPISLAKCSSFSNNYHHKECRNLEVKGPVSAIIFLSASITLPRAAYCHRF